MITTPYDELNEVLQELVSRVKCVLGDKLIGIYLQGSIAIGGFDEHSDVDFIAVIDGELSPVEVEHLQELHDQFYEYDSEWAKHLEGSYFPSEILRFVSNRGKDLWYLDHGARELVRSDHCNTILVRWVIRESGVVLFGPQPETLVEEIKVDTLRSEIFDVMNYWGEHILEDPSIYSNRFYQGYIVLNYCRMLHDLITGFPGSKQKGAAWAKSKLDPKWIDLIDASWDCRPDPATQVREPADPEAYDRTLQFLRYILDESKKVYDK